MLGGVGVIGFEVGRVMEAVLRCLGSEDESEKERRGMGNGTGGREDDSVGVLEEDMKGHSGIRTGYSDLKNGAEGDLVVVAIEGTS